MLIEGLNNRCNILLYYSLLLQCFQLLHIALDKTNSGLEILAVSLFIISEICLALHTNIVYDRILFLV